MSSIIWNHTNGISNNLTGFVRPGRIFIIWSESFSGYLYPGYSVPLTRILLIQNCERSTIPLPPSSPAYLAVTTRHLTYIFRYIRITQDCFQMVNSTMGAEGACCRTCLLRPRLESSTTNSSPAAASEGLLVSIGGTKDRSSE